MKKRIKWICPFLLFPIVVLYFSCKSGNQNQASTGLSQEKLAAGDEARLEKKNKPEADKKLYRCPMHPNYTSDKPGTCPICGMNLVPAEKEEKATPRAAKKKTMYRSTMNPNEISDKPGKDSMGMEMVPFEVEEGGEVSEVGGRITVKISPERQQLIGVKIREIENSVDPQAYQSRGPHRLCGAEHIFGHSEIRRMGGGPLREFHGPVRQERRSAPRHLQSRSCGRPAGISLGHEGERSSGWFRSLRAEISPGEAQAVEYLRRAGRKPGADR